MRYEWLYFGTGPGQTTGNERLDSKKQDVLEMDPMELTKMKLSKGMSGGTKWHLAGAGAGAMGLAFFLTGCGMTAVNTGAKTGPVTVAAIHVSGNVHGGQQPVAGSTIQLYAVGTTGLRTASTPLVANTVTTDSGGNWNITGMYTCPAANSQVYVTAVGGNPGGGTNSALSLTAALGTCGNLNAATYVIINEVTTVTAAYGLAPFAADLTHIGATGTGTAGISGAFNNSSVLSNFATGQAPGVTATGVTIPTAEINTLADIIASCVNTTGSSSGACQQLFAATGASDTFGAALSIAKNPGATAITALYTLAAPTSPFQPTMSYASAPNDFTVAVKTTGGGTLATPYGVAIDANGYGYVANESGTSVTVLGPATPSLANTIAPGGLYGPQGVAIDRSNNLWIANTAGNSVIKIAVTGPANGIAYSYTAGITGPTAVALDSASNAWVSNFNSNSVAELSSGGVAAAGSPFTGNGNISLPQAVAVGPAGNIYVASGSGAVVKLSNAGAYTSTLTDGTLTGTAGVAVDPSAHVLATGFTTGNAVGAGLSEFTSSGAVVTGSPASSGLNTPQGVATDGTSVWVVNGANGGSLAQYTYGATSPVSPTAGYGTLNTPVGVAVDASGCVWTTNSGDNTVSKFIGLSAPIATPIAVNVGP